MLVEIVKQTLKVFISLSILGFMLGCSKGVQNNIKQEKQVISERESMGHRADIEINYEVEPTELSDLAKQVLDTNYLNSPKHNSVKQLNTKIHLLNSKIIKLHKTNPTDSSLKQILTTYVKIMLDGCDGELRYCRNAKYFVSSHLSYKVLLIAAANESEIFQYYRILKIAGSLINRSEDPALTIMYISRSDEYTEALKKHPRVLQRHYSYLENLLANFTLSESSSDNSVVGELLKNYNPWKYNHLSRKNSSAASELFKVAAKSFLYETNGNLNHLLKSLLREEKDNKESHSFWRNKENIEKSDLKTTLMKGVDLQIENDEFLFLIDRLFTGKLLSSEVSGLLTSIRKKYPRDQVNNKLIKVSIAYYYAQIGQTILDTKSFTEKELILNIGTQNKSEIFNAIIQKSTPLSLQWNNLASSNKKLFEFIVSEVGTNNPAHDLFLALDRNIKYVSVYPMMALMSYYISIYDLSFTLRGFFGEYEVKSERIISDFLDGKTAPWFNFTPDTKNLEKAEILLSLYYLNQLGLLQSTTSLNTEQVFYTIFNEFLLSAKKEIQTFKRDLLNNKNGSNYNYLMHICRGERERRSCVNNSCTNSPVTNNIGRDYKITIENASQFRRFSFLGTFSKKYSSDGHLKYFNNFYSGVTNSETSDSLDKIYNNYLPKLNFIKTIYNALNMSNKDDDRINRLIQGIDRDIQDAVKIVNTNNFESSKCLYLFAEIESQQNFAMALKEKQRLELLHDDIVKMQKNKIQLDDVNNKLKGRHEKFGFFDYVDRNGNYVMHKSDSLLRFITYLNDINSNIDINLANYENDTFYKTKSNVVVPFNENKTTFVSNAMKSLFSNHDAFEWFNGTIDIKMFLSRFNILIKTNNLNPFLGIENTLSLVDERKELLKLIHINSENKEDILLKDLDKVAKFPMEDIREVLFDDKMEPWNLHSYSLDKMNLKSQYFADVVSIHNTLSSTGTLIFPVGNELYNSFSYVNTPLLNSAIGNINKFIFEAQEDFENSTPFEVRYSLSYLELNYKEDSNFKNQAISLVDLSNWQSRICELVYNTNQKLIKSKDAGCSR